MARGELYYPLYRPQFSGHETFPMRYGWLKKAFDAVYMSKDGADNKHIFLRDDAIARFGVGKNMVASMRHWATAAGIIDDAPKASRIETTPLGLKIFGPHGLDPYMECPATLWLIHWNLCGRSSLTTWHWAFSHFSAAAFDREHMVKGLMTLAADRGWARVSSATVKRDVECLVRTYASRPQPKAASHEDAQESPLLELGLMRAVGRKDGFRLVRGTKLSLGPGVFAYALLDFWSRYTNANSLSFEAIAHEPGSPGRVFLLEEDDLVQRLPEIDKITRGAIQWSETAGLKQLIRTRRADPDDPLRLVALDYRVSVKQEAA